MKDKETKKIQVFKLKNSRGMSVEFTNMGATITAINVPDRKGRIEDVALGFVAAKDYRKSINPYFGGVVGRVCNRIAKGKFKLAGKLYLLATNDGKNHLHGGNIGFNKVIWSLESHMEDCITFTHFSPDGDEGYPGNLKVRVSYTLSVDNKIHIRYEAESEKDTPINLSNHTYFNLKGEGNGTIGGHKVQIHASFYIPVDSEQIPIGIESVIGTPFDLRLPTVIDKLFTATENLQMISTGGVDHNFILDTPNNLMLRVAAHIEETESGRVLDVLTTEPGIQFYTGNHLDGSIMSKNGLSSYVRHSGFCLETQHFPDSVNQAQFPSTILNAGKTYLSETVFMFSTQRFTEH
jgi:aldose 1-epimerase